MNARMPVMLLAAALASFVQTAVATPAEDAKAVVEQLHATLLEAMKGGDTLGFDGRYELIAPVLEQSFDFPTIARVSTGRHWSTLDPAKQAEFIGVFKRLSAATYAENFDGFDGQRFETEGVEEKRGMQVVRTAIVSRDGSDVSLSYTLGNEPGEWRIVNVVADGVSDLSLKRAEYTAVIQDEGIDSLIAKLNDKIRAYESNQ